MITDSTLGNTDSTLGNTDSTLGNTDSTLGKNIFFKCQKSPSLREKLALSNGAFL